MTNLDIKFFIGPMSTNVVDKKDIILVCDIIEYNSDGKIKYIRAFKG